MVSKALQWKNLRANFILDLVIYYKGAFTFFVARSIGEKVAWFIQAHYYLPLGKLESHRDKIALLEHNRALSFMI